jgi:hypothetical protein
MLLFRKGQTSEIICTLHEKITDPTDYRFVFKGIEGQEVVVSFSDADDLSTAKHRYNQFEINTDYYFGAMQTGLYSYRVSDDDNNVLEIGIMRLLPSEGETMIEHQPDDSTFTIYAQ